jgi:hypothetical protein
MAVGKPTSNRPSHDPADGVLGLLYHQQGTDDRESPEPNLKHHVLDQMFV